VRIIRSIVEGDPGLTSSSGASRSIAGSTTSRARQLRGHNQGWPGAQRANPLPWTLAGDRQFDCVTGTSNPTAFALDPATRRATVTFRDGAGATIATRSYAL
jgi:hypothetical protein